MGVAKTKSRRILIIEDEPRLIRLLKANLLASGYEVGTAADGKTALHLLETSEYDLVILDIMLPGPMNGFEVCSKVREFSEIPVIMLTGRVREQDRIRGFDAGADDYLTKPFSIEELLRRIRAVLRRSHQIDELSKSPVYAIGDLVINFAQRRVFISGKEVCLTATEYQVLYYLARNAGKVILHEELLSWVWGPEYRNEVQYLRSYIGSLRKKVEADPSNPKYILAKHGVGYYMATEVDA